MGRPSALRLDSTELIEVRLEEERGVCGRSSHKPMAKTRRHDFLCVSRKDPHRGGNGGTRRINADSDSSASLCVLCGEDFLTGTVQRRLGFRFINTIL